MLAGDTTVNTLTGGRISGGGDPERDVPSVTFEIISSDRPHTHSGPDDLVTPTVRVTSWARSDLNATTLANAVRDVLNGFSGTVGGLAISYMALVDQSDDDSFRSDDKILSRHGVRQDYLMTHTEL